MTRDAQLARLTEFVPFGAQRAGRCAVKTPDIRLSRVLFAAPRFEARADRHRPGGGRAAG